MNRDHYLSKCSQPPLMMPPDKQVDAEGEADAAAKPGLPVEPTESRSTNVEDTAKQEVRSDR